MKNFKERCHQLVEKEGLEPIVEVLQEEASLSVNMPGENSKHFSLSQLFIQNPRVGAKAYDYLAFVLLEFLEKDEQGAPKALIQVISPEGLRNYSRVTTQGIFIEGIEITMIEQLPERISTIVYQIPRTDRNQRLIAVIERLVSSLDFSLDYNGSVYLAESILDRLEVLTANKAVIPLIGGTFHLSPNSVIYTSHQQYFAFLDQEIPTKQERKLWIANRNLHIGRSVKTSKPFDHQNFLLFRIGEKSSQENQITYIHELRRQHILSGTVSGYQTGKGVENLLEREARLKKSRDEERVQKKFENSSQSYQMLPVVTPIALEVASDLIFLFEDKNQGGKLSPFFDEVNVLRDNIQFEKGVRVPGIRVRGNETDLPDGTYIIMLNEIPIVSGNISVQELFVGKPDKELQELGIKAKPAVHPANSTNAAWVSQDQSELLKQHDITFWPAIEYIIQHLSAILIRNLSLFVGVQELTNMFEIELNDSYLKIQETPGGIARYQNVIHALLQEEVPIVDLEVITNQYLQLLQHGIETYKIPEEIRLLETIRSKLRGNKKDDIYFFGLHPEIETMIKKGILQNGDGAILAIEPDPTQELLSVVRAAVSDFEKFKAVIVVKDNEIRPFVRKLIELEFPGIHVMAHRELNKEVEWQEIMVLK